MLNSCQRERSTASDDAIISQISRPIDKSTNIELLKPWGRSHYSKLNWSKIHISVKRSERELRSVWDHEHFLKANWDWDRPEIRSTQSPHVVCVRTEINSQFGVNNTELKRPLSIFALKCSNAFSSTRIQMVNREREQGYIAMSRARNGT